LFEIWQITKKQHYSIGVFGLLYMLASVQLVYMYTTRMLTYPGVECGHSVI